MTGSVQLNRQQHRQVAPGHRLRGIQPPAEQHQLLLLEVGQIPKALQQSFDRRRPQPGPGHVGRQAGDPGKDQQRAGGGPTQSIDHVPGNQQPGEAAQRTDRDRETEERPCQQQQPVCPPAARKDGAPDLREAPPADGDPRCQRQHHEGNPPDQVVRHLDFGVIHGDPGLVGVLSQSLRTSQLIDFPRLTRVGQCDHRFQCRQDPA